MTNMQRFFSEGAVLKLQVAITWNMMQLFISSTRYLYE